MLSRSRPLARTFFLVSVFVLIPSLHSSPPPSWRGILRDPAGNPIDMAAIKLFAAESNGQRGSAAVFAIDGADTTDPELGGATFSNFNVDAIQEVQSNSGVMPADTGHGASGFTNVDTRSGSNQVHGSLFEFVRNAAF